MIVPLNYDGTPTPGVEPDILTKDGSTVAGATAMGALFDVFLPLFNASTHFGLCEFHTVDPTTGVDQFIFGFNLGGVGSSGGARVAMGQFVMNFKTTIGSLYRLYLMETSVTINRRETPPFSDAIYTDVADYIASADSPVYGRANAYPFAAISWLTKTNDKLRKAAGLA
jgi:hypothetical protein